MEAVARKLFVISSFIMVLYFLQYSSLLKHTYRLVRKHVVEHNEESLEDSYTTKNGTPLVGLIENNDETESEYVLTKAPLYMAKVSQTTDLWINAYTTQQQPMSSRSLVTLGETKTQTLQHTNGKNIYNAIQTLHVKSSDSYATVYKRYFERNKNVKKINCFKIFNGSDVEISRAVNISKRTHVRKVEAKRYIDMTKHCRRFINDRGYITSPLTEEERAFPIAYSILMYKYVEQMERLLRAIYRPQNVYCIHVDAKTNYGIYQAVTGIANCFENVHVTSKRINVKWGKISVLEPDLLCMKELWRRHKTWKYFINLTGQEFPLRTNHELVQILKAYNGSNDVETTRKRNRHRWERVYIPRTPYDAIPTKGAVHVAVSRGYVDYILHDKRARDILAWANLTKIPDETFFSTINHNPHLGVPGSYKGYPETTSILEKTKPYLARFKNRMKSHLHHWPCHGNWVRGICIFSIGDLPLLARRKELFANKFHLEEKPLAYSCLEELIFNRTRDEYLGTLSFDASWYASLGFVSNKVE